MHRWYLLLPALSAPDTRIGWSDELLGFDCGGQQWVHEVCFPCGTPDRPSLIDLEYMEELLDKVSAVAGHMSGAVGGLGSGSNLG